MLTPDTTSFKILEDVLTDPQLSYRAKGLFAALCYRKVTELPMAQEELAEASTEGKTAVASAMRELKGRGYVKASRERANGRYSGSALFLFPRSPGRSATQ